jgi:sugar diacid utilization regulator
MKKLLLLVAVALSGCTVVDAFLLTPYDANEYAQINAIRTQANAMQNDCVDMVKSSNNAAAMARLTQEYEFYSQHIPRNDDGYSMSKSINEMAQGLKKQYDTSLKVSPVFCKFKFQGIERSAETAQKVVGARPR